jgi:crotonobetainyl-CoA:carnitine CoA-transferase CaiB-like acyl-CoA transferase
LGADIIKVEMPSVGDDILKKDLSYIKDKNGENTKESANYLSSNRNKRSVSIDLGALEGRQLVRRLIENVIF